MGANRFIGAALVLALGCSDESAVDDTVASTGSSGDGGSSGEVATASTGSSSDGGLDTTEGETTGSGGDDPEPGACPVDTDPAWEAFRTELQAHIEEMGLSGVAVAIVENGTLCRAQGFGNTTVRGREPVTPDTLFRWGSVAKMHTAMTLLQLVDEGAVSLEDPVTMHVQFLQLSNDEQGAPTLFELLTHTSGVPDDTCADGSLDPGALEQHFTDETFRLQFPPGAIANYANPNYWLAALVIEQVEGERFADVARARVLEPAGMQTATFDVEEAESLPHAFNVSVLGASVPPSATHCARGEGSGMLYASVSDLGRMLEVHLAQGAPVLPPDLAIAMREQVDDGYLPEMGERYGYGLWTHPYKDLVAYIHTGSHSGYRSVAAFVPEADFGIALVSNTRGLDRTGMLDRALEQFLAPADIPWPPDYSTPSSEWAKYEGIYEEPEGLGTIEVSLDGETLQAQTDSGTVELTQAAGDRFYWNDDVAERDVIFWEIEGVVTYMATRSWVATRVP